MDCSKEHCDKTATRRGLCQAHYRQERRRELDPAVGTRKPGPKPQEKASVEPATPVTNCPQQHRYDEVNTYVDARGSRHCKTCRRERMAVRRPASGVGAGGVNAAKTVCPAKHEYTEENTYRSPEGKRYCRTCMRMNMATQNVLRYGITPEQVEEMSTAQDHRCAICRMHFGQERKRHIDHDHSCCPGGGSCGKCVRALLCASCNHGLGKFLDSPELLRSAAAYLEKHRAQ